MHGDAGQAGDRVLALVEIVGREEPQPAGAFVVNVQNLQVCWSGCENRH